MNKPEEKKAVFDGEDFPRGWHLTVLGILAVVLVAAYAVAAALFLGPGTK